MTVEKPMRKCLLRPITTPEKSAMNQLEILAIACNLLKVEENSRGQCDCHWLKKLSRDYQAIYLVYQS